MDAITGREADTDPKFWSLFEQASAGMALISPKGRYLRANPALRRTLGYTEDELAALTLADTVHPEDLTAVDDLWNDPRPAEFASGPIEIRYLRRDGQVVWVALSMTLVRDEEGVPMQAIVTVEDITGRRQEQMEFERARQRYQAICDSLDDFVAVTDLRGDFLFANAASADITGYMPPELLGSNLFRYVHPDDQAAVREICKAMGEGVHEVARVSYRAFRKDGLYVPLEALASPFSPDDTDEREIVWVSRPDRHPHLERTRGEALALEEPGEEFLPPRGHFPTENLTGVHHGNYIDNLLGSMVVSRRSANFPFGVLLVDIDHFSTLNSRYGQAAGDEILQRVAQTLHDTCRLEDTVGRAGGDLFLILLPNTNPSGTIVVGERVVRRVRAIDRSDTPVESEVTVSIGATCVTYGADLTLPELMGILHDQLSQAKETGGNRLVMNSTRMARG